MNIENVIVYKIRRSTSVATWREMNDIIDDTTYRVTWQIIDPSIKSEYLDIISEITHRGESDD
jgi:hypothetical protein